MGLEATLRASELTTPVPLIDVAILEGNLRHNMEVCRANRVAYRPHIKTHKMPVVARKQVDAGAVGITCAKVGEAEVMARGGLKDIFLAYCVVGRDKFERLLSLTGGCQMSVGVDSMEGAKAIGEFFDSQKRAIDVVMEIDTGHHRCGVTPEHAGELATFVSTLPGVRLKGIFTHEGHVYSPGTAEERLARARLAGEQITRSAEDLRKRGLKIEVVSVGSSPARDGACRVEGVTENRPGTNIFNDCTQVKLGAAEWKDCALSYECTVVSRPAAERAIIDGGSKTFSSDQLSDLGVIGALKGFPGAKFGKASEEHGIISLTDSQSQGLRVGDRVQVIPSHACGSINLHNRAFALREGEVVEEWKIEARGCVN